VPSLERLRADLDRALAAAVAPLEARQSAPLEARRSTATETRGGATAALEPEPARAVQPRRVAPAPRSSSTTPAAAIGRVANEAEGADVPPDPVPLALDDAARAFFAADYELALRSLDGLAAGEPRVEAARHLLAAAASLALFAKRGERDPHLLESARTHAAACRQVAPDLALDGLPFSPRFVAFYRAVPAPAGPAQPARAQD
jgi:hypothetical protein